jgi:hypothetical protein
MPCGHLVVDNSTSTNYTSFSSSSIMASNVNALLHFMDGVVSFYSFTCTSPKHGTYFSTSQQCIKVKLAFQRCFILYNSNALCKLSFTLIPIITQNFNTTKSSNKLVHVMFDNPPFCFEGPHKPLRIIRWSIFVVTCANPILECWNLLTIACH